MNAERDYNQDPFIEQTLSSEFLYDGQLLKVYRDEVRLPNGNSGRREIVRHPGACAIIPLFENGDTILLKQYRYAPAKLFWEVPAGKIDHGEALLETARRELLEETGYHAKTLHKIGHFYPCIGFSDEIIHVYLAKELEYAQQGTDDDEFIEVLRLPIVKALAMLDEGSIEDGKTLIALQMVRSHL